MSYEESILDFDGKQYLRVPVHARIRPSSVEDVPEEVRSHVKVEAAKKAQLYWQDAENPDLVWVNFILDSEGTNKNNDFMPRTQLLESFHTAKFKPMDMEHIVKEQKSMVRLNKDNPPVKNTIFGVMTNAALADHEGKLLTPKQIAKLERTNDPHRESEERVTVVAWAAMYYFLFPETVKELVKVISSGDMFVSMERWLRKWDFLTQKADEEGYDEVPRDVAEKTGVFERWKNHQSINNAPVIRRTLSYSYGGVASTANPANELSRFIDQSRESRVKAAAALAEDPVMQQMVARHDQVVQLFAGAETEQEKSTLGLEHTRIHRAIAAYIG